LLINLGTPDSPSVSDVRRYLREFLSDPRVIDIPAPARWLLLNAIILPFRPKKSAAAYKAVWMPEGSPLLVYERAFEQSVRAKLGARYVVELGMRYGSPSIAEAFEKIEAQDVEKIVVLPLFPQYASASTGSALERTLEIAKNRTAVPDLVTINAFYDHPEFIESFAAVARPHVEEMKPDHVLFSYHGIPERHVQATDPSGAHCLKKNDCCDAIGPANRNCYRAQCYATTRALAAKLGLSAEQHSVSFQSRLGRTPWIKPYTDLVLPELAKKNIKKVLVLCPAFVADCLETVEEIGIRAKEQWAELGGAELRLVPSLNAHERWVEGAAQMIRDVSGSSSPLLTAPRADVSR
jgi:protoporphyrin/coproporphyrin ferrochelatase